MLLSSPGFIASVSFWIIAPVLLLIILAGGMSTGAVTKWQDRPRLAPGLLWTSVIVITSGCIVGAGIWDIFVLPGALLLLPAALKSSERAGKSQSFILEFAGGVWAVVFGLITFSIVSLPGLTLGFKWSQILLPSASILLGGLLTLAALISRVKMPLLSTILLWAGIAGISIPLFLGLGYFSVYVFPAIAMLVFSALKARRKQNYSQA